jgi:threonine/homoserine/homoserine lactone efflux protein
MDPLGFIATVVLLTASGALAPGPLFLAAVSHGTRFGAKSGLLFSIAHTMVEFTLVMLLTFGLLTVINEPAIRFVVGFSGGIVLIAFGVVQIHRSLTQTFHKHQAMELKARTLLLTGLAFTGLNPFFVLWWLTVGANLIFLSLKFASLAGVLFMYVCHVWMDYIWLTSVSHLAKIGANVAGHRWYRGLMLVFGVILIYFGTTFLIDSLSTL